MPSPMGYEAATWAATDAVDHEVVNGWEQALARALNLLNPVGKVSEFAGASLPSGSPWLLCHGQAVSRSTYADLFDVVGTTYGDGDGSTTFNLPDMRGRIPIGRAASGALSTLGAGLGSWDHTHGMAHTHGPGTLATNTVANHQHGSGDLHTSNAGDHTHTVPFPARNTESAGSHGHTTGAATSVTSVNFGAQSVATNTHGHTVNTAGSHLHGIAAFNFSSSGGGVHQHSVLGFTSAGGAHGHSVVSGNTGPASTSDTGAANPPVRVLNFIIYTGVLP